MSVILFTGRGGLCPSMHHRSNGWGVYVQGGSLSGCLCLGGSVQGGLCLGVSVWGSLCPGGLCAGGSPSPAQRPSYGNERAVRILLECILVKFLITKYHCHLMECSVFLFYFRIHSSIYCWLSVGSHKKLDFSFQSNSWSLLFWLDNLFNIWHGKETNYLIHLLNDTIHIGIKNIFLS